MPAIKSILELFSNDNPPIEFTIRDEDSNEKDLTGAAAVFAILEGSARGTELVRYTAAPAGGITIPDQAVYRGKLRVQIAADALEDAAGEQYFTLWVQDSAGQARTVAYGPAIIRPSGI